MSDILNRYICSSCNNTALDFMKPKYACKCGASNWRKMNTAKVANTTATVFGTQYDSVNTLDEDVDRHTQEDQTEKDWKKIEESRRG
jgi:hypothetical protein